MKIIARIETDFPEKLGIPRQSGIVKELFGNVANLIGDRKGGYLRILRVGRRLGDNAELAMIEFVDYNNIYSRKTSKKESKSKNTKTAKKVAPVAEKEQAAPAV